MKHLAILLLAASVPAFAQSKVVLTYVSGNVGTNALPTCPATSPTSCVTGFTMSRDGKVIADPSVLNPASTTFTDTPLPTPGSHTYSLVMNGFDAVGSAIASSAVTATVNVPAPITLAPPTGFKAVAQ